MNSRYKDKLVGVYAPGSYDHTSVLGQTHYHTSALVIYKESTK